MTSPTVLIGYDFLTTLPYIGKRGAERFDFLQEMLNQLDMSVQLDDDPGRTFDIQRLFALHNNVFPNQLVNHIEVDLNIPAVRQMIEDYLRDIGLFIGYELSASSRRCLDELNIPYLDVWFSPLRFGKDAQFSLHSNVAAINEVLNRHAVPEETFQAEADALAGYCRHFLPVGHQISADSALLIGQLFIDKASQCGDRFVSLLDYVTELKQIATQHSALYLLKHPLMSEADFIKVRNALAAIDNLHYLQGANVYQLMADERITRVIAVSSSVVLEARYFSKQTEYLYQPVLGEEYVHVRDAFYSSRFWCELLNQKIKSHWHYFHCDNWLRAKFDAFYAYGLFTSELFAGSKHKRRLEDYQALVNAATVVDNLPSAGRLVLYGAGSVGGLILPALKPRIAAVIDKGLSDNGVKQWHGVPVWETSELQDGDLILIGAFKYRQQIEVDLATCGKQLEIFSLG